MKLKPRDAVGDVSARSLGCSRGADPILMVPCMGRGPVGAPTGRASPVAALTYTIMIGPCGLRIPHGYRHFDLND